MPKPGSIERHVVKKVRDHTREANRRGLSMADVMPSTTPTSTSVQWPGCVVDPAWMKANPSAVASTKPVQDWRDFIFTGIEETMTDRFNPKQIRGDNNARVAPCMWTPLTHDFIEGLAYIIDRVLMEPDFRAKIQVIPGGKVDPQPVIGINELREVLAPDLETLLAALQTTVVDGVESAKDKMVNETDTLLIRSVWETDIQEASVASDVKTDELQAAALASMDDIAFEAEAARRGFRMVRL